MIPGSRDVGPQTAFRRVNVARAVTSKPAVFGVQHRAGISELNATTTRLGGTRVT